MNKLAPEIVPAPGEKKDIKDRISRTERICYICALFMMFVAIMIVAYNLSVALYRRASISEAANEQELADKVYTITNMATALCRGEFETIYQHPDDKHAAIVKCAYNAKGKSSPIYSILYSSSYEKSEHATRPYIRTAYLGEVDSRDMNYVFEDYKYIYRYSGAQSYPSDLFLFVNANSETAAVDKVLDDVYKHVKNEVDEYVIPMMYLRVIVFYSPELESVNNLNDYLILTSTTERTTDEFPYYLYDTEFAFNIDTSPKAFAHLVEQKENHSAQITNALNNRHTMYTIWINNKNHKTPPTKEEIRTGLMESYTK
jgi:hypothetical protein